MTPIFFIVYAIWILSEILINRLFKSTASDQKGLDKNTVGSIWIAIAISCTLSVLVASYFYFPIAKSNLVRPIGLAIIIIGCLFRILVIKSLGREFTSDVTIRQNHQLKTSGIYQYLRHPSYSFSILSFVGFGLSLNNWISLVILILTTLFVFLRRIKVEESALITEFGKQYTDYMKKTSRLVPFIY